MKLAFCLYRYFPYGGLQRDLLHIAHECHKRGHEIHVYTMKWEGDCPTEFQLHLIDAKGLQNHTRNRSFANKLKAELAKRSYDLVIGFNEIPDLDLYFAAAICYQARARQEHSSFYRLLPRYREMMSLEKSVFHRGNKTKIMLISALQQEEFVRYYQTETERFYFLPPGINKNRIAPSNANEIREAMRKNNNILPDQILLLMVGSGFKTKGVDRAINALAALPPALKNRCQLFVIGQDNSAPFLKLANQLHVHDRLHFLGGRSDVSNFLLAADLLLHPAYYENTGTVLLEAIVAGLPVLTVDACGYAHYVTDADAGLVLNAPFQQDALNDALQSMLLSSSMRQTWHQNGLAFAKHADIYSMPEHAANLIEITGAGSS